MTATETMFIQIGWCLGDIVSHDQSKPVTSKTTTNYIDKIRAFKQGLEFWKTCIWPPWGCQDFLDDICGDINKWDFVVVAVTWNA